MTVRFGKKLRDVFLFQYEYDDLKDLPVKISVSELKKRSYHSEQDLEETVDYEQEEEIMPLVPRFIEEKKEETYTGALRGTAYHRVMECLDYAEADTEEQASGSVKETSGEPENDRAGSGMYPDPGYQEVCRVRAGAENEEGCYEKTSLQRTAFCDPEKCFYAR